MKSKLLASAVGLAVLGTSALALADNDRGHNRGYHGRPVIVLPPHAPGHYWSHPRPPAVVHQHWHGPAWRAPYYHHYGPDHYGYARRPYQRYDDGVTIIFKGRID